MVIYIGYDSKQPEAYEVCKESILRYNRSHVIKPLIRSELEEQGVYWRPFQNESTEFAFTRFLVPYLSDYQGYALFCDSDFMWRCDPAELFDFMDIEWMDNRLGVYCVQHPAFLPPNTKMNGKLNLDYRRKYWSSLMLFNNRHCKELTKAAVNQAPAGFLHEMLWADGIGSLPAEYNAMINYYQFKNPKAVHFTDGGPWHGINDNEEYSQEWQEIYKKIQ